MHVKSVSESRLLTVSAALVVGAVVGLTPRDALALPTPDVVLGVGQAVPVIASAVAGVFALGVGALLELANGRKDPKLFLGRCVLGLAATSVVASLAFAHAFFARRGDASRRDLAAYFRCDVASHEAQHRGLVLYDELERAGRRVNLADIDARLRSDPSYDPILVTVSSNLIYDAGFLVVGPESHRKRFRLVHQGELRSFLMSIPEERRKDTDVVLDVYQRMAFGDHAVADYREYVRTFPRLRVLRSYVGRDPFLYVEEGGTIRPAKLGPSHGWPVRNEKYYREEARVEFPNMKRLLSADELGPKVADPDVWILAPYDSAQRSRFVHVEYLSGLLARRLPVADRGVMESDGPDQHARIADDFAKNKVLIFDQDSPHYDEDVRRILDQVRGHPFVIVGVTKYDWIHVGLNLAYLAAKDAHARGTESGYLGGSLQASEYAAAALLQDRPSATGRAVDRARAFVASGLGALGARLGGSLGWALALLAVAVRLATSPFAVLGAISARRRAEIEATCAEETRAWRLPFPMACRAFVRRHLGVSQRWELLAALSSVVLVVPMVTLLVYPQGPLHGARFLGIDLEAPSAALDAAVIGVVALRVGAARRAEGKRIEAWQWAAGALALGLFFWLMQRVAPAGLAVYVFASVLCMTLIDALVAWTFRPMRTLLAVGEKAVAAPREPRFVIPLAEVVPGEVGNKASRLGALARATSPLFDVPSGFVLRVDGGPFASAEGPAWRALLDAALRALPAAGKGLSSRFAVRSCAADEDGGASSKAGKYLSVLEVEPSQIADAVVRVRAAFGDASRAPGTGVIVQRMVEADYSGVIFTSSPGKRAMARIEFGTGLADALVGGERAPTAVHVSRFSGEILGPPLDATVGEMLERVFFAGMAIERHAGAPQDVEWAYVASERRLFVVQSRAVTAFVEPAAVEREQAHAILTAYQCGLRERDVPAWVVSASAEVVDQACPFTLSLLTAIFRPGSSYEKARAWCGLRPPPAEARTVAIFGRMYQIAARRPSVVEIVASAVADRRARRALLADHRRIVDERERTMRRLRQAAEPSPLSARSLTPRLLIHAILASVDVLVGEVYPLVFASSLAAQLTLSPRTRGLAFPTLNSEYLADLAALAAGGDLPRFLARWGHRSTSDYDLLVPSFREAPEPCLRYAQAFRDLGGRGAPEPGAPDEDPHVAFVRQREVAKDLSIALLRLSIRPRLLELAGRLGLERAEDVFFLALDDLRQLAQDIDPGARARRLAAESRADHEVLVARALPDPLTLRDLELLGVHEAAAVDPARVADPGRGQMLSVEAGFEGAVVRAEDAGPLATGAAGAVLLTRTLRPDLVPLFAHARGVVTETGGYLSHAAIVAREMGIPVLLLANARAIMTEGDVVHVTKHGDVGVDRRPAPAALPELRRAS